MKRSLSDISKAGKESDPRPQTTSMESSGNEPGGSGEHVESLTTSTLFTRESNEPIRTNERKTIKQFRASNHKGKAPRPHQHVAAVDVTPSVRLSTTVTLPSAAPPDPNLDIAFGVEDHSVYAGNNALIRLMNDEVIENFTTTRTDKRQRVTMKLVRALMAGNKRLRFVKAFATIRETPAKGKPSNRAPRKIWKCLDAKEAAVETVFFLETLVCTGVIEAPSRPPSALSSGDVQRVQSLSKLHANEVKKALSLIHVPEFSGVTSTPIAHAASSEYEVNVRSALNPLTLTHNARETPPCNECKNESHTNASGSARESHADSSEDPCNMPIADMDFMFDVGDFEQQEGYFDLLSETVDCDILDPDDVLALQDGATMQTSKMFTS
jgi:hypothetical protein